MVFQPSQHSGVALLNTEEELAPESESPPKPKPSPGTIALLGAGVVGLLVLPTFVIYPWAIKQFKPEWSYGQRVAAGMGISMVFGAIKVAAASGSRKE
jgi:hypothetical protein